MYHPQTFPKLSAEEASSLIHHANPIGTDPYADYFIPNKGTYEAFTTAVTVDDLGTSVTVSLILSDD